MSNTTSPTRFSGESDHFYDPNFTAEISQKMRVPKRIKVDGESDEPKNGENFNHWMPKEKLDMHVPEKIVVLGNQFLLFCLLKCVLLFVWYSYDIFLFSKCSISPNITLNNQAQIRVPDFKN
jgi:hypothetical protein